MMNDKPNQYRDLSNTATFDQEEPSFDEVIRVMSFNILSDDDSDHAWEKRKNSVASMIRFHRADLIGLQEPSAVQIQNLNEALVEYATFPGIYNPIMYRKSRFELLDAGSFYLSSTPDQPSLGWDAKFFRASSWAKFLDKKTKHEFVIFNTHFDYHGVEARNQSAELLKVKVGEIAGSESFIITGDFNLFPQLEGATTYELLTENFSDALTQSKFPHHGPTGTWSGFKEAGQPGIKPDCIFVSPNVEVILHGVLSDTFDGKFPSDHLPVVADLVFKK